MINGLDFLITYSQVAMAFVAFATIVATLRQAFGGQLTPWQNLLFRFYVETGFMFVLQGLIPIAMINANFDDLTVWRVSNYMLLFATILYMPFYLRRRFSIDAPVPFISILVMTGYGIVILVALLTATEIYWQPSFAIAASMMIWGFASNIAIFVKFLGSFVEIDDKNKK